MSDEDLAYMNRETDALIAVKVFKWEVWQSKHGYFEITTNEGERHTAFFGREIPKYDSQTGKKMSEPKWWEDCDAIPYYTGNMEAAWDVAREIYKRFTSLVEVKIRAFDLYECTVYANGQAYKAEAVTAPLAICSAALKSLEVNAR
jgi:hypothetical protein